MTMHLENSMTPLQRVLQIAKLEKQDILLLFYLTLVYGVLGIATPVAVQTMVNIVTMGGVLQPLYVVGFILFCLLALSGAIYAIESFLVELIQRRIFVRTSMQIADNMQQIHISVYDKNNTVELVNRYFDIQTVQKSVATLLTIGLTALLQGLIGSIVLLFYSLYFGILVVIMLIVLWAIVFGLGKQAEESAIQESKAKYNMAAWLENIARNKWLSKFYGARQRTQAHTEYLVKYYLTARTRHFKVLMMQLISGVGLYALIGTGMLILGGTLVIQGQINLGQFVAAELIIFGVLSAFVRFITKLEYFYDLLAAVDKIGVLETLPQETSGEHQASRDGYQQLQAFDMGFKHHRQSALMNKLNFKLQRGQGLAILGGLGSGKSTLLELITGLRQPDQGYLAYNGIDLRQLDLNHLRDHIGVANKVEWQHGSIFENLRLHRADIEIDMVIDVLQVLGLWDDISKLEHGIETELTDFGAPLTYTQLQRLMLARAIIGKPDLMIIDGLLDGLAQHELDQVLNLLKRQETDWMLIVTTRFQHIAQQFQQVLQLETATEAKGGGDAA
ncbi:peptidase domain-containing ABC transporter [Methylophilus aquaticus]|uniref:ATP-binding cassette domain-containing protein n=1 Tax=Methylophilus aquaticus TaxID=1971610 RepID=A0ABT9JPD0_9PROT|nr:ATP-binding cassette domain-containing protein [Methylophilus aquaticus]MDP8566414.1 ATP-binding cassette domain-containing protein [Methylophilus aquaticus]